MSEYQTVHQTAWCSARFSAFTPFRLGGPGFLFVARCDAPEAARTPPSEPGRTQHDVHRVRTPRGARVALKPPPQRSYRPLYVRWRVSFTRPAPSRPVLSSPLFFGRWRRRFIRPLLRPFLRPSRPAASVVKHARSAPPPFQNPAPQPLSSFGVPRFIFLQAKLPPPTLTPRLRPSCSSHACALTQSHPRRPRQTTRRSFLLSHLDSGHYLYLCSRPLPAVSV